MGVLWRYTSVYIWMKTWDHMARHARAASVRGIFLRRTFASTTCMNCIPSPAACSAASAATSVRLPKAAKASASSKKGQAEDMTGHENATEKVNFE